MVKVKDICIFNEKSKIKAGEGLDRGKYPFYTSSKELTKYLDYYEIESDGIIMGTGGNVSLHYCDGCYSVSTDCLSLHSTDLLRNKFLYYYFLNNLYLLEQGFKGAGLKHTSKKYIQELEVSYIPSIYIQDNIIKVLDEARSLIENRQKQLEAWDVIIKSRFIELFGDPISNHLGWKKKQIQEVCDVIVDCPHSTPSYTFENTGFMCIRTSIIKPSKILWDKIEYIPENEFNERIKRYKPQKGDIVYSREGAILGIAAIIDRDCEVALGQRSMLLSSNKQICNPTFLCTAMNINTFLNKAKEKIGGSASPHINVADIKAFEIIVPPIDIQNEFSNFVIQVEKHKKVLEQSLDDLGKYFSVLLQKSFKGDLFN